MGHIRLGRLPRTRRWKHVIELLEQGASTEEIARATFWAAYAGLAKVPVDAGFTQTLTAIFQFVDALQSKNPISSLREKGFSVTSDSSLFDFIGSFQEKATRAAVEVRAHSDLAQLAQESFTDVLVKSAGSSVQTLFGLQSDNARKALQASVGRQNLGQTMHEFFVGFTQRYLNYYLGRELPSHVGVGKAFTNVDKHSEFGKSFDLYVRQTVRIADQFTPGWFGKARYEGRLSHMEVSKFAGVAFKKIRSEFRRGAEAHG